jgi:hypothetical protein
MSGYLEMARKQPSKPQADVHPKVVRAPARRPSKGIFALLGLKL